MADVEVLYNFVSSDHKPLIFKIHHVSHAAGKSNFARESDADKSSLIDWSKVAEVSKEIYQRELDDRLSNVNILSSGLVLLKMHALMITR